MADADRWRLLLIMVILPGIGREVNGSMRWIGLGAFNVQPSELAKVFGDYLPATWCVARPKCARSWMGFSNRSSCCRRWRPVADGA